MSDPGERVRLFAVVNESIAEHVEPKAIETFGCFTVL